ncbi:MAG: hypothetical protein JOZ72_08245 [Alphaproteobacteria bacterium]|nr:hypothetical protein [Alphaproteobacteria bacterium]
MPLSFEDMLDEFRALGGVADNIALKEGRFGRGLFAADPERPVRLHVPEALLVETVNVAFENGALRIAPGVAMGARAKAFVEAYEQEFSWGPGRRHTEHLLGLFREAPAPLRALLAQPFNTDAWLVEPTPKTVQDRFIGSRAIRYRGRAVLMPMMELVNHGHAGRYETENGITLSGRFAGELLAAYEICDPLRLFNKWGFACSGEPMALSLAMRVDTRSGPIVVERGEVQLDPARRPFYPDVRNENGVLKLSYLMLGHMNYPRLAKGNFYRILRDAGRSEAEETFDKIQHVNRLQFYKLIAASEDASPELARLLRDMARYQLEALSCSVGVREV